MKPINKQTGIVTGKSNHLSSDYMNGGRITSLSPLPVRPWFGIKDHNLTGKKAGRFTITGCAVYESTDQKNRIRWVGRCSCGRYQYLKTKTIKNNHPDTACVECRKTIIRSYHLSDKLINKI